LQYHLKMKMFGNVLLIIVILVAIIIPLRSCQTSIDKTLIDNYSLIMPVSIITILNRKTVNACLEGQRKDQYGRCHLSVR